jgi:hypothetical protein
VDVSAKPPARREAVAPDKTMRITDIVLVSKTKK